MHRLPAVLGAEQRSLVESTMVGFAATTTLVGSAATRDPHKMTTAGQY